MFRIFRRALDAKMKLDATRAGVTLKNKKEERVPATENEEQKFCELGLLVYYYNRRNIIWASRR